MGDEEAEVVKKVAGLRFFFNMFGAGSVPSLSSCMGVRVDNAGRKMVKLFRRLLPDMIRSVGWKEGLTGHSPPALVEGMRWRSE